MGKRHYNPDIANNSRRGDIVFLSKDKGNSHDKNAIKVVKDCHMIGHVHKGDAIDLAPAIGNQTFKAKFLDPGGDHMCPRLEIISD